MSRSTTPQPETHGVTHSGQAPQVAVRDGNRLLCPCCGQTIMVLKQKRFTPPKMHHAQGDPRRTWPSLERLIAEQEAHYQNGSAQEVLEEETSRADDKKDHPAYRADSLVVPIDPKVASHEFPPLDPPPFDPPEVPKPVKLPKTRTPGASYRYEPPRDWNTQYEEHQRQRRKRPLEEATSYEMARLYAWAYYRLQRLAVQIEKEIAAKQIVVDQLQSKLDAEPKQKTEQQATEKPMNANPVHEEKSITTPRQVRPGRVHRTHTQADLGVAPGTVKTIEKATTNATRRHAHADEGMAPQRVLDDSMEASRRGPP